VPRLRVHDDLRELGADSLSATMLAAAIEAETGIRLPVSKLAGAATVEGMAALVTPNGHRPAAPVPRAPRQADHPTTPQQQRLYFEQCKDLQAVHYNVPVTVDLPAGTDPDRLVAALHALAGRHDALRTELTFRAGELRQRLVPASRPVPVEITDTEPAPFVRPFDLERGPLWRAALHPNDQRVRLLLDLHHSITDGVSLAVLVDDLGELYHAKPMGPPPPSYLDYAHWSAGRAIPERHGRYWAGVFADPVPRADLPLDFPRPPLRALAGGAVEFEFGARRSAGLRRLARSHQVTLFAVLAAAYSVLLARLTGQRDVVLGTPVSGRTAPGFERTAGMFVNTVCLRTRADASLSFAGYVELLARRAGEAFEHQDYPLQDLVAAVAPRRDYRRAPLFDALLALHSPRYLHTWFGDRRLPLRLEWNGQAVYDLNLQIYQAPGSLLASWQYAAALLRPGTVAGWRDLLLDLIDTTLAEPDIKLGELTGQLGATRAVPDLEFDL
jgi:hypothetical protein